MSIVLYQNRGQSWNLGGSQSGSDLNDREESHIPVLLPTKDRSKVSRYDGRKNSKSVPNSGIPR